MPRVSDISEASHETLLAPPPPGSLLICLILSAGKGSDATKDRPALGSNCFSSWPHCTSEEEVGKWTQPASVTGTRLRCQVETLVAGTSGTRQNHEWIALGAYLSSLTPEIPTCVVSDRELAWYRRKSFLDTPPHHHPQLAFQKRRS